MISKHSAHSTSLPVSFSNWLWRYTCLLLLISMLWFESCIQQRKTTCLLSIWISLACARASTLTTTNVYIALVVNSSDSKVWYLKIGVIEQSAISHLSWMKWLATDVFLLLRMSNWWLLNLCLRKRFVWPTYCKPQLSHSIKYIKSTELQLMLVCILMVCLVAVLAISECGSKYSQVGH